MAKLKAQSKAGMPMQAGIEASEAKVYAEVVPFCCTLSNLRVIATTANQSETILHQAEPIALEVSVEFGQSGAIALMPLALPICVEFFARPVTQGDTIALGSATQQTIAKQFNYTFTVSLPHGFAGTGLIPDVIAQITALLRVGVSAYPALIHGVIEGVTIQTYQD